MPEPSPPPEQESALTSSFPAHFFSPAGVLAGVDPARLPTPADALPGFEGPASPTPEFGEISDTWARLHLKGIDEASDPRKATLVRLVSLCKAAGLFFSATIKTAVADALGLPPGAEEREEYSAFGSELYFAAEYLEREKTMAEEAEAWAENPLKAGKKLKTLRIAGSRVTGVQVVNVSAPRITERNGQRLAVKPAKITVNARNAGLDTAFTLSASGLRNARQAQLDHQAARNALAETEGTRPRRRYDTPRPARNVVNLIPQPRALTGGTPLTGPATYDKRENTDSAWPTGWED